MLVTTLWAAFNGDLHQIQLALRWLPGRDGRINPNIYHLKNKKLVDILDAFQLVEDYPEKFEPVDWKLYKAERVAEYARRRRRRSRPPAKSK